MSGKPIHGLCYSPEYRAWQNIKWRCYRKKSNRYKYYGAKGIIMCDKWLNSFQAFYNDVGPRPFPGAQIDRKDNKGNYEPSNCRWTTCTENNRNRPRTKLCLSYARKIRDLYKSGLFTHKQLAKIYKITTTPIECLLKNKTWKENNKNG